MPGAENSPLGLYFRDTRYPQPPRDDASPAACRCCSRSTAERGYAASVEFTNLEIAPPDGHTLPQTSVHVRRTPLRLPTASTSCCASNYHQRQVELVVDLHFDADFRDMFEVRGLRRHERGTRLAPKADGGTLTLAYYGLDEVLRKTVVRFERAARSRLEGRQGALPPAPRAARAQACVRFESRWSCPTRRR